MRDSSSGSTSSMSGMKALAKHLEDMDAELDRRCAKLDDDGHTLLAFFLFLSVYVALGLAMTAFSILVALIVISFYPLMWLGAFVAGITLLIARAWRLSGQEATEGRGQ